ncbi:MAG TPA: hypothetical protein VFV69_00655 [Steroidobacteraceae bacterium]|jgi:hypothetical protein|nr:hypothetical protein [Steroidobacteraceae bacterium]
MRFKRFTYLLLSAAAALVLSGPSFSDELQVPNPAASGADKPTSGMSMDKVEAKYGAPTRRVPPVGGASAAQPPITRWEYPGFTVYFENNHVVHTVVTPS